LSKKQKFVVVVVVVGEGIKIVFGNVGIRKLKLTIFFIFLVAVLGR
jgi:type IV secretory pathway VirB2 component (pilin)